MDTLLSLLILGALFFFMMRFGCGAHMSHGRGHGHSSGRNPEVVTRDPVCGMEVAANSGLSKIVGDRKFHFCSRRCLEEFESAQTHRNAA
jgi:YHS domain-containing protein